MKNFVSALDVSSRKNFFSLPNEIFFLCQSYGAVAVYAYLLYREDRSTRQCHPSLKTISNSVGLSINTVQSKIKWLEKQELLTVEHSSYTVFGAIKNRGNNIYTLQPVRDAMERYNQREMEQAELENLRRRAVEAGALL